MKLTFNPPQLWASYIKIKQDHRDRVYDFINDIAETAEQLVEIWESAIVNSEGEIELPNDTLKKLVSKYPCNAQPYLNLSHYYKYISSVMGEKFDTEMEPIIFHVSSLINGRNLAREQLSESLKNRNQMIVFDQNNERLDTTSLQDIIYAMRNEAAALKVKAHVFKTIKV